MGEIVSAMKGDLRMLERDITLSMIEEMQHCIGFHKNKVRGTKHRVMYAYRNHYCDHIDNVKWQALVKLGLASQNICEDGNGITYYHLTQEGFDLLARISGLEGITEID